MAILDKPTWKQKFQDFIDRISPFDSDPLIQKAEHQELVGTDLADSTIYQIPIESAINSPAAAFSTDFDGVDQYNIDTTGVGTTAFTITLQNLLGNSTGILNITKKAGDTFTFANGTMVPVDTTDHQTDITRLFYQVKNIGGNYVLYTGVETGVVLPATPAVIPIGSWNMDSDVTILVAHAIPNAITSIVGVRVAIIEDGQTYAGDLWTSGGATQLDQPVLSGKITWDNANFRLVRGPGYDLGNYNDPGPNRGNILVWYTT